MHSASFDLNGNITFDELKTKPLDLRRLQAAMFTDRPDLWRKPSRKHQKPIPPEQLPLPEGAYCNLEKINRIKQSVV